MSTPGLRVRNINPAATAAQLVNASKVKFHFTLNQDISA